MNVDLMDDEVLNAIFKNLGWEPEQNDARLEEYRAKVMMMTPREAFECYCNWHGIIGWSDTLMRTVLHLEATWQMGVPNDG